MPNKAITIGLIQMSSSSDVNHNLLVAEELIRASAKDGAEMVVLPETFSLMEKYNGQKLGLVEKHGEGLIQDWMSRVAKEQKICLVGGTIAVQSVQTDRPYARCYVYNEQGQPITHYDKIHLFDVAVKDDEVYSESDNTLAGTHPQSFEYKDIRFGMSVCYDLRFPELFRQYQQENVEVVLAPSAFTLKTGEAHWQLLLQARGVENLCFVAAPNQTGLHDNRRKTYGHSMVVGPWGDVLTALDDAVGYVNHTIDTALIGKIKQRFPVHTHRRL